MQGPSVVCVVQWGTSLGTNSAERRAEEGVLGGVRGAGKQLDCAWTRCSCSVSLGSSKRDTSDLRFLSEGTCGSGLLGQTTERM